MLQNLRAAALLARVPLFALFPLAAWAQSTGGEIVGTIRSERGKPVPFAYVGIQRLRLGALASADGSYWLRNVPSGTHELTFEHTMVETKNVAGVVVEAGRVLRLDVAVREHLAKRTFESAPERGAEPTPASSVTLPALDLCQEITLPEIRRTQEAIRDRRTGLVLVMMCCGGCNGPIRVERIPRSDGPSGVAALGRDRARDVPRGAGNAAPLGMRIVSANPARGPVNVSYALAQPGSVRLEVFDVSGRRVAVLAQGAQDAGEQYLTWDGRAAPGVYLVRLEAGGEQRTAKITVVR
jgi:hypothetical protein